MSLKFNLILTAVDRASAPLKRIQASAKRLSDKAGLGGVEAVGRRASAGLERVRATSDRLAGSVRRASAGLAAGAGRLRAWANLSERAGYATGRLIRKMGGLALAGAKWTGLAAVGAVGFGVKSIISTASQFEKFQTMLETTEGSSAKAKKAMDWVTTFAAKTPYELDGVMDAFVRLRAYGIDPTDGTLRSLGDGASAMGKNLMDAVEMMADAQTGELERLKSFGITGSKAGKQVTLTYHKNGKELKKTVTSNAKDINGAIRGIFNELYAGGMDKLSGTFTGMMSNLSDQWTKFQMMVANAGFFDAVKSRVAGLLERINAMAADGRLEAWAKRIAEQLTTITAKAFDFINNTNWGAVAEGMGAIVSTLTSIITKIGQMANGWRRWQLDVAARQGESAENGWLNSAESKARGRAQRQAAERELGGPTTDTGRREALDGFAARSRRNHSRLIEQRGGARPRTMPTGAVRAFPIGGNRGAMLLKPQPVEVGGKVAINVAASPLLIAKLTKAETANRQVPFGFGFLGGPLRRPG